MYSVIAHDGDPQYGVNEYVCDSVEDLIILPRCAPGSTAIVLQTENAELYMKNSVGEWIKL
jgi:hypothetical protein